MALDHGRNRKPLRISGTQTKIQSRCPPNASQRLCHFTVPTILAKMKDLGAGMRIILKGILNKFQLAEGSDRSRAFVKTVLNRMIT